MKPARVTFSKRTVRPSSNGQRASTTSLHWPRAMGTLAIFVLMCLSPQIAFGANPAEEMAKHDSAIGGGIDPAGDSWQSIQHSVEQFRHPEFMLRLFLSLALAVACAWVVAWHPRSARVESLSNLEERKTLVLLGMVGAVVAELSGISQTL